MQKGFYSMKLFISALVILFSSNLAIAADTTVEMLNKLGKEKMVFSEKIVRVDVGETVFWKSTNKGHNVEFISKGGIPKGVKKFKSKVSKDTKYKFEVPGIYAYQCTPHKNMGMIAFIVVGNNLDNLEAIKAIKFRGKSKKVAEKLLKKL
jgi:pseudoazurin|tara:strand:- start:2634 stop:3083 length:450 start_codon:yes stop_codon:yes gene_type:complete